MTKTTILADAIYNEHGATRFNQLSFEDGVVTNLSVAEPARVADGHAVNDMRGHIIMPGFINSHSHAFQRILRGRVERHDEARPDDDFWTWREEMYAAASTLSVADVTTVTEWAYAEMLETGFTAVGEFHYLHHQHDGRAAVLAEAIVTAARNVGIRLCLIHTAYLRGGFDKPLSAAQSMFAFSDAKAFCAHVDDQLTSHGNISHAVAIHSVRAVAPDDMKIIADFARSRNLPLHVHAAEQRAEIAACMSAHAKTPIGLLDEYDALTDNTVLVHATHISDDDIERIARARAQVCLCPSTERNLGDGLCPIQELFERDVALSIGTDSHARIDAFDEARSLEEHERLRTERRLVLRSHAKPGLFPAVMPALISGGRRALGMQGDGILAVHASADFVVVKSPIEASLAHEGAVPDALVMSANPASVRSVYVGGAEVVRDGRATGWSPSALAQLRPS